MSFANPTPLRLGMVGDLFGKRYRVAGRVVLGVEEAGQTYYWNEFHLVGTETESATLVYEETDHGEEWRLFIMFEPEYAMTAEDAATKRVGDLLDFGDGQFRVSLVDQSRVYHIEGEAPEGVETGDVARYFNAEAGNKMTVVSWTGNEVEYYRGMDVSRGMVMSAFNLRAETPNGLGSFLSSGQTPAAPTPAVLKVVVAFVTLVVLFAGYSSCRPVRRQVAVTRLSAPASPLKVGSSGEWHGRRYRIQEHAVVEIAQVGLRYDRHEYHLFDENGNRALLVCGWKPGEPDWVLFEPLQPLEPLTAQQAAAVRWGQTVKVDGIAASVDELSQSTIREVDIDGPESPDLNPGDRCFNFSGRTDSVRLLVRWQESHLAVYRGTVLPEKEMTAALGRKTVP